MKLEIYKINNFHENQNSTLIIHIEYLYNEHISKSLFSTSVYDYLFLSFVFAQLLLIFLYDI